MKNLLFLIFILYSGTTMSAIEIDTLWLRTMSAGAQEVDFTPDDKHVIAWTNSIEFWEVQEGIKEFSVQMETVGDYNFNEEFLVFACDSTPKLLNWKTREIIIGFEKENRPLGRIRTAKSKNEFMSNTIDIDKWGVFKDENTIYFWDINLTKKSDSLVSLTQFEIKGQKWGRKIIDYDYLGNSDEFFYVKFADDNSYFSSLPPSHRMTNYYYHFYNRISKELIDSIFIFQEKQDNYFFVDKMQVMKDRSKIAWNNIGGELNFYDLYTRKFYKKLVFDNHDFIEAVDIEFNSDESIVGMTHGLNLKIYDLTTNEKIYEYFEGSWQNLSFSSNNDYLVTNVGSWLVLIPSHTGLSSIKATTAIPGGVYPNPASDFIKLDMNASAMNSSIEIYDAYGKQVMSVIFTGEDIDISSLTAGVYFVKTPSQSYKFIKL